MTMSVEHTQEIYRAKVLMKYGVTLEGFVPQGGEIDGFWIRISRTDDLQSATYINRDEIAIVEISGK
ncbi:hypothetical protein [Citrobacter braakii]|uniref:hypothetical protein n=1 Tax=Citrobacter braakii TaxID=57706 RepID=UPI001C7CB5D7|nr:hypothetical protein [Citrobacter braakii]